MVVGILVGIVDLSWRRLRDAARAASFWHGLRPLAALCPLILAQVSWTCFCECYFSAPPQRPVLLCGAGA